MLLFNLMGGQGPEQMQPGKTGPGPDGGIHESSTISSSGRINDLNNDPLRHLYKPIQNKSPAWTDKSFSEISGRSRER